MRRGLFYTPFYGTIYINWYQVTDEPEKTGQSIWTSYVPVRGNEPIPFVKYKYICMCIDEMENLVCFGSVERRGGRRLFCLLSSSISTFLETIDLFEGFFHGTG